MPTTPTAEHRSVDATILTNGAPLVWKCVPVNVMVVAEPDSAATGLIAVTVCRGSETATATEVSAYGPPDVDEKQILFPADAVPVPVVSNVTLNVADVSEVAVSCPEVVPASAASVHAPIDETILTYGAPLVWKLVPVNAMGVTVPDTAAVGMINANVCTGNVIAITMGLLLPSTAAAYVPPAADA